MDTQYEAPFLDYYKAHNLSPVSQNIADLKKHFERRQALYRHCGITSSCINGKTVLEVGPGTGHNAIVTNAMRPRKYLMVDGNLKSVEETNKQLQTYFSDTSNCELVECNFEEFELDMQFDIVLCEGTVPGQKEPTRFLNKLAHYVKPSGILLITCIDHVSVLSETLRKIASRLILNYQNYEENQKLEILRPFLTRSLKQLPGMSRSADDWIYDNVLQPIIGELFSIEDAIKCLHDQFDAYSTSPHFSVDWRWYKNICGPQKKYNNHLINAYKENIHNLIDYRHVFKPVNPVVINKLERLSQSIFDTSINMQNKPVKRKELVSLSENLKRLTELTLVFSNPTSQSIRQFSLALDKFLVGNPFPLELGSFEPWFGRGQQYLSLIKKDDLTQHLAYKTSESAGQ